MIFPRPGVLEFKYQRLSVGFLLARSYNKAPKASPCWESAKFIGGDDNSLSDRVKAADGGGTF
jgi:hypothetical protein